MDWDVIEDEANRAHLRYGDFHSTHEALGVLIEEVDELRAAIHANALAPVHAEAVQVAAVAGRLADIALRAVHRTDPAALAFRTRSGA